MAARIRKFSNVYVSAYFTCTVSLSHAVKDAESLSGPKNDTSKNDMKSLRISTPRILRLSRMVSATSGEENTEIFAGKRKQVCR